MKKLIKEILGIISLSGNKLKINLVYLIILGTILESLSIGLVVPLVVILSKGTTAYTKPVMKVFTGLTGIHSYWVFLTFALTSITLFYLFKTIFLVVVSAKQSKFVFGLEVKISDKLLRTYLDQPYEFHLQKNSAQLTTNIYSEVKQLSSTINQGLNLLSEMLVLCLLSMILLYFQPLATLFAVVFLGITIFIFIRSIRSRLGALAINRQKNDAARVKTLSNILMNVKDIKLYGRNNTFSANYHENTVQSTNAFMQYAKVQKLPSLWLEFIAVVTLMVLIGVMIFHGNTLLSIVPLLSLFAAAMFRVLPSVTRISSAYQIIKLYTPVVHTVYAELNTKQELSSDNTDDTQQLLFKNKIVVENLKFTYQGTQKSLFDNINLTINKGEYVGFIGQSGCGKSTLIDIIIGLLNPQGGSVKVDGINIKGSLRGWQNQIGYVAQTINLIDDTLASNIALGVPSQEINLANLNQAIIDARLENFINELPDGVNTMIGERGVRLSGGQRQRIGIARALYHRPTVLVFDEATSALDTNTEAEIMRSINLLKSKETILFVTHKNSLLKDCDVVYEINNDKVVSTPV